jgi:hypothetical protein
MRKVSSQPKDPKRQAQLDNYMKDSERLRAAKKQIRSKLEKSAPEPPPNEKCHQAPFAI